ncbi:hypothetical protein BDP27DRAFT_1409585 [Rhodocollybia butyracea]|uniref:Fungal-type protein kinase domain-containing protein n=1 Tax=Rhodocollybia butyracea TaxID=206335 RepID=A0A9P5TVB3_9AGAR|nr:hypothetical protein BDP27DRAFT_1409585 [Rhodocollybia butyracea]
MKKIDMRNFLDLLPEAEGMPAVKYNALVNIAQMKAEMQQYALFASKYNPDSTTNSASVELFGEFKVKKHDNPFPPAKTLPESAKDTRGQITLYLNAIQAAQQRTRMQYRDPFNHTTMPYLHKFLWRLTHSSPADRGHDVTMEPVLPCDPIYKEVSQVLMAGLGGNPNLKALHKRFYREVDVVYRVVVNLCTLYVYQPFTTTHLYPVGQGTRCFVAFDHENRRLVLLKDFWRNWKYDSEYKTYKALECKGVSHVPHALAGEDIAGRFQQTKVLGIKLVHFRLVLDIVGEPLTKCISMHQFAQIISDALQAHYKAYRKAGVLHRDISSGNIIFFKSRGYLIDWECSIKGTGIPPAARTTERTGTWQFMSIKLLEDPDSPHQVCDDLKSFFYVMLFMANRYASAPLTSIHMQAYRNNKFSWPGALNAFREGATGKRDTIGPGCILWGWNTLHFQKLINEIVIAVCVLYCPPEDLNVMFSPELLTAERNLESHEYMITCFSNTLRDESWRATSPDWAEQEMATQFQSTEVICKKLKIGAEYKQFVTTRTEYYDIDSKEDSKEASGRAARKGSTRCLLLPLVKPRSLGIITIWVDEEG